MTYLECFVLTNSRQKIQQHSPSNIFQIHTSQSALAFEGDILITYGPALAKNNDNASKTQIVHIDLVDSLGQMTITTTLTNKLIEKHLSKVSSGSRIFLIDFFIKKRS